MNILEKNINALESRYGITDINSPNEKYSDDTIVDIIDVDGKLVLTVQVNDEYIRLDSLYDSEKMLDIWYKTIEERVGYETILFMYGLGNGSFVKKYLQMSDPTSQIRVYEPSYNVFVKVVNQYDISDLIINERVLLYLPFFDDNITYGRKMIDGISIADLENAIQISYLNYHHVFKEDYIAYFEMLKRDLLGVFIDSNFMGRWGKQLNDNIFHNFNYLINSKNLKDVKNKAEDLPAIIVSAGPSLDKNVDKLVNAKNKSVIITVDSAVRTLIRKGIVPDIIVTGDPTKDDRYLEGNICDSVPLVTSVRAGWKLNKKHKGIKYFYNTGEEFILDFLNENSLSLYPLGTGGSVANTAFSFAVWIGCKDIIFVGQDLAYPDDNTHASDSVVADVSLDDLHGNLYVDDIYGNKIKTSDDMNRYRRWFEKVIENKSDLNVYDATEGGAFIKGTKVITLQKIIEELCTKARNVDDIFQDGTDLFDDDLKKDFLALYHSIPTLLINCKEKIRKLKNIYSKMNTLININKIYSNEFVRISKNSNSLLDEIEKESAMCFVRNDTYDGLNSIFAKIKKINDNEKDELKEIVSISEKYIEFLSDSIDTVINQYENCK